MSLTLLRHAIQKPPPGTLKLDLANPLAQGLELWHIYNAFGSAVIADVAARRGGRNGNVNAPTTAWASSPRGSVISLDGSSTNVVLPDGHGLPSATNQQWTLSIWVRWRTPSNFSGYNIMAPFGINQFEFSLLGGGSPVMRYAPGGQGNTGSNPFTWNVDEWHHIAVTDDGNTTITFYFDGKLLNTASATLTTKSAWDNKGLGFGSDPISAPSWVGALDNPMIWSRVLSAPEIASVYAEPYAMLQARPIQRWFVVLSNTIPTFPAQRRLRPDIWAPAYLYMAER